MVVGGAGRSLRRPAYRARCRRDGAVRRPAPSTTLRPVNAPSSETLTIFFPMWNEEVYIERTLTAGKEVGDELVAAGTIADYELIVIDDASTDHTGKIADDMAAADRHIKVVHHPVNRKLGGSIKTGFAAATG